MSGATNISWTDRVWNCVVGCSRVSPGCENCYAENFAHRLEGMGQERYRGLTVVGNHGARWTGEVREVPQALAKPLRWRKPCRVFVNSMSDLFHESLSFEYMAAVFGVMAACPHITFQVLTKRPQRALAFFEWLDNYQGDGHGGYPLHVDILHEHLCRVLPGAPRAKDFEWPLPGVHLGVTAEDQQRADERIPILLQCPAAVRWVSFEPLLGHISLLANGLAVVDANPSNTGRISWAVVGGETGEGRRERPVWELEDLVAQLDAVGCPVFVKQDAGKYPGRQGRISDAVWARKEFPG